MVFTASKFAKLKQKLSLPKRHPLTGVWHGFEDVTLNNIQMVRYLGKGAFGSVALVNVDKIPSRTFALKLVSKQGLTVEGLMDLEAEKANLNKCVSNFIVQLYWTYQDSTDFYFLMESCLGGDLHTLLKKFGGPMSEFTARFYIGGVVEALKHLHSKNVVHRDLKPSNIMLDERGYVKVADFGLSKDLSRGRANSKCGTLQYMAPEVILKKWYDHSVDYWSLGVILFQLITGRLPFDDVDNFHISANILKGHQVISFPDDISRHSIRLVRDLCQLNASERIGNRRGIQELVSHHWFSGFEWEHLQARRLNPPYHPKNLGLDHNSAVNEMIDLLPGFEISEGIEQDTNQG